MEFDPGKFGYWHYRGGGCSSVRDSSAVYVGRYLGGLGIAIGPFLANYNSIMVGGGISRVQAIG